MNALWILLSGYLIGLALSMGSAIAIIALREPAIYGLPWALIRNWIL